MIARTFVFCALVTSMTSANAHAADWQPQNVTDHLRGVIGIGAYASGSMQNKFGTYQASLSVNCADNSTTVGVSSRGLTVVGDSATVSWTLNGGSVNRGYWQVCQSNDCVGLWNGAGISFAKSLFDKVLLRMVIAPKYGGEIDVDFAIAGARDALQPVGEKCGWLPKAKTP
jgi:hypothetical protein